MGDKSLIERIDPQREKPDIFSDDIKHLAGQGLRNGTLRAEELRRLCGSVLEHVESYKNKTGIFRNR